MDREANLAAIAGVEIGMRGEEGIRLLCRRVGKAVDIMVAVALGMGDTDQGAEREVLLHGEPGLAGQVFARDEIFVALRAPFGRARRVDDRLVETFAGFRGDAAIAERTCRRKRVIGIVPLVDDEVAPRKPAERRPPGDLARHRLLDIEQLRDDRRQRAVGIEPVDQRTERVEIGILLVGVECDAIGKRQRREFIADQDQARGIGVGIAAKLELEVARAGILACVGDAARALNLVLHADGMAHRHARQAVAAGKETRNVVISQIARQPRIDAGDVGGHAVEEVGAGGAQQRVQDRLVDLGRAVAGRERRDVFSGAGLELRADAGRVQAERGVEIPVGQIELAGNLQRPPHLGDTLFVRQMRPLVEPFRRQHLRRRAGRDSLAFNLDRDADEDLGRIGDRHRAEAERPRERDRTLEKRDVAYGETRRHVRSLVADFRQ